MNSLVTLFFIDVKENNTMAHFQTLHFGYCKNKFLTEWSAITDKISQLLGLTSWVHTSKMTKLAHSMIKTCLNTATSANPFVSTLYPAIGEDRSNEVQPSKELK